MKSRIALVPLVLILLATGPQAATYRWVDEQGKVHYTDSPPPDGAAATRELNSLPTGPTQADLPPVVLYSIPGCDGCNSAREYLNGRGVPFTEINVAEDRKAQEAMKERVGALAVPTLLVGDKVMSGYMRSLLEGELTAAGYAPAGGAPAVKPSPATEDAEALPDADQPPVEDTDAPAADTPTEEEATTR
ncbi:MAG: glutaredoxin family protein [Gammaproteobacteria bacterium]|nr:glutaredoxin family protein [Gammaproteobacteria bacterium]